MFRRVLRAAIPVAVAGAVTAAGGVSQAATAPGWRITATVSGNLEVSDLAASGAGNAWTAGTTCANASCSRISLVLRHWNGKAWTAVAAPKAYVNSTVLSGESGVAAASGNAWIMSSLGVSASSTAVLHWTGKGWGTTVKLPAQVTTAVASSTTDVWAFGTVQVSTSLAGAAYAARYDGKKWSRVRVPLVALRASATSAKNVWAVGLSVSASRPGAAIMSFNGKTWRSTPMPNLGLSAKETAFPTGIAAVSATNAWAEVTILNSSSGSNPPKSFLLHWNGAKWAVIKVPYARMELESLAQDGHGGVWTVGVALGTGLAPGAYFAHYANGAWSRVAAPTPRGYTTLPGALTWIPGTRSLWGLGDELPVSSTNPASPTAIYKYGA